LPESFNTFGILPLRLLFFYDGKKKSLPLPSYSLQYKVLFKFIKYKIFISIKYFTLYIIYTTLILKILLFWKIIYKKKKALQQRPKGWKLTSSPYWAGSELLIGILQ